MIDDSIILKASGNDVGTFLQGQLTCDMKTLAEGCWTYGTYCTPQGKVLAILWIFPWHDGVLLRLPRSTAPIFLGQIRKYILRSDVQFHETTLCFGALAGENRESRQRLTDSEGKILIGGVSGIIPFISEAPLTEALPAKAYYAARIRAGIPEIYADTAGIYLPQMLGLETIGGLSFDKGCYVGQENIARLQYKSKLHRHLAIATVPALASGQRILHAKGKIAGTLLDYGYDQKGGIVQAVIEDRYLGKPLRLGDDVQTLIFQPSTNK